MRKYNIMRPILILAVAFFAKTLTNSICLASGTTPESAENISFAVMIVAAIITYIHLTRKSKKSDQK